jgi:hypothetical protein
MLNKLAEFEVEHFEAEFADQNWYKGKQHKEIEAMEKARKRGKLGGFAHRTSADASHHQGPAEDLQPDQEVCDTPPNQAVALGQVHNREHSVCPRQAFPPGTH